MAYTEGVRKELPRLLERHGVKLLCDAGCGDRNWIKTVDLPCEYRGFDLHYGEPFDITADVLPACDAILCRDVLIHMRQDLIEAALANFRKASKFLIATSYDVYNHADLMGERPNRRINLGVEPFSLPFVERIEEEAGKYLGLWILTERTSR